MKIPSKSSNDTSAIFPTALLNNRDGSFNLKAISFKDFKSAALHIGLGSYITEIVARRWPIKYLKSFSSSSALSSLDRTNPKPTELSSKFDLFMCKFRCILNYTLTQSADETLWYLASWLGIDPRQFMILSETSPDFSGSVNIRFLFVEDK